MKTKYTILLIAFACILQKVNAQSFALQTPTGIPVNNGDTLVISGTTNVNSLLGTIVVINNSSSSKSVQVRRENLILVTGASSPFAWGLMMYDTAASVSINASVINAGAMDNSFYNFYDFNGLPGISYIRFGFFDENNPSDSACLVFQYNVTQAAGITESLEVKSIRVGPNPGNGIFNLSLENYDDDVLMEVYNSCGKIIIKRCISNPSNTFTVDLSNQSNGYYTLNLINKTNQTTRNVIVIKN